MPYCPGFDLTFQKSFVNFVDENNHKADVGLHDWERKKIFHSMLPKTVLNSISLLLYLIEKHQSCILYKESFIAKEMY